MTHLMRQLAGVLITAAVLTAAVEAWRADRRDRAQLAAELVAAKKLLADVDARQRDRDAQLAKTLATLDAKKRVITTPGQIARDLPREVALPAPISFQTPNKSSDRSATEVPVSSQTSLVPPNDSTNDTKIIDLPQANPGTEAIVPAPDLKPLYDFVLDCKACQAKLSATQADLSDEKTKTAALTKERDGALRIARGGTIWHRVARAAKWFALGAAAGAIAVESRL